MQHTLHEHMKEESCYSSDLNLYKSIEMLKLFDLEHGSWKHCKQTRDEIAIASFSCKKKQLVHY